MRSIPRLVFSKRDRFPARPSTGRLKMNFKERAAHASNTFARCLLEMMHAKKSLLCVALDVSSWEEAVKIIEAVGDHVVAVKTHFDIWPTWTPKNGEKLRELALKHEILIIEDRKFGDIGNVVKSQAASIFEWAHGATMHSICGSGSLDAIRQAVEESEEKSAGVFLVAELSCAENLILAQYTKKTTELAVEYKDVVTGLVAQTPLLTKELGFVQLTPGVSSKAGGDNLGQTYVTPSDAVLKKGGDLIVVGRAITKSSNPGAEAKKMQETLWNAYLERTSDH